MRMWTVVEHKRTLLPLPLQPQVEFALGLDHHTWGSFRLLLASQKLRHNSCIPILIVRIGCGLNSYEIPKHSRETTNSFLTQPFFLTSFVKQLICTAN